MNCYRDAADSDSVEYARVRPHPESQEVAREIIETLCNSELNVIEPNEAELAITAIASALDAARAEKIIS